MNRTASILLLAVALGAGCRGSENIATMQLEPHEFAGITVSLPKGGEIAQKTVTYRNGEVMFAKKKGKVVVIGVSWQLGEPLYGDELLLITEAFVKDMKRGEQWEAAVGERTVYGVYYSGSDTSAVFGSFACGNRSVFVMIMADGKQTEMRALHERIIASVECVDDEEAGQTALAPVFTAPPGFGYDAKESSVHGALFTGLDGSMFMFFHGGNTAALDNKQELAQVYEKAMGAYFPGLDLSDEFEEVRGSHDSRRWLWSLRTQLDGGAPGVGLFLIWHCKTVQTNFVGMYVTGDPNTLATARAALLDARCPNRDADPTADYPTVEAVFDAACKAGDQRGCPEPEPEPEQQPAE